MEYSKLYNSVFNKATSDYHLTDHVDTPMNNPYPAESIEHRLYKKNWIDAVQWHLEDIIRNPDIQPEEALDIKRRIDRSNQERTDLVEAIDEYFRDTYKGTAIKESATLNTESPAWAIDRLSILVLKIYHMEQETERTNATPEHLRKCKAKLNILLEQQKDLSLAIDQLLKDIKEGRKYMKTYKQMKMYNDPTLNPILYENKMGSRK